MVCTKHKILLNDSSIQTNPYNKYEIIEANENNCIPRDNSILYPKDILDKLYKLALNSEFLLNSSTNKHDRKWYIYNYRNYLRKHNLASVKSGVIKQNKLYDIFKAYYRDDILETFDCNFENNKGVWIRKFFSHNRDVNTLKNLLVLQFLNIEIEKIFAEKYEYNHFGKGPWPCLNQDSDHYRHAKVNELVLGYNRENGYTKGKFICDCGFKYSISSEDSFENILENIDNNIYSNLNDTEKFLQVLDNYSDKIDINLNHSRLFTKNKVCKSKYQNPYLYKHREIWLNLRNKHPLKSKSELIDLCSTTASWLYKFDKEWLDEHSPSDCLRYKSNKTEYRLDWKLYDLDTIIKAKSIVDHILEFKDKPIRITSAMIVKSLKRQYDISADLNKLPKTKSYIDSKIESIDEFRLRKIKWAAKSLIDNNKKLTLTNIANEIYLSNKDRKRLKIIILNEINKYSEL